MNIYSWLSITILVIFFIYLVYSSIKDFQARQTMAQENVDLKKEQEKRLYELTVLYDVSNAISYTMDYEKLDRLVMGFLPKIIDFDVSALLLMPEKITAEARPSLFIQRLKPVSDQYVAEVKNLVVRTVDVLLPQPIKESDLSISETTTAVEEQKDLLSADKIGSFFNVPIVIRNQTMGLLNISSRKAKAFSRNDLRIIHTIANQLSSAIQRLREVAAAEKSKMDRMVEAMVEGIILTDEKGQLTLINPSAKRILGIKENEPSDLDHVLEHFQDARGARMPLKAKAWLKRVLGGKWNLVTKEIYFKEPRKSVVRIDVESIKDKDGKILGAVTVLRDITELKDIDAMKSEFVSTVSHELRTPLSIIKEGVSIVLDGLYGEINEKQNKLLSSAKNNIERLNRLINDLLDISKIEAHKVEIRCIKVDIIGLACEMIKQLQPQADKKKIDLKLVGVPDQPVYVFADPDKLDQIFTNLLFNAIKFTPEQGSVSVSLREEGAFAVAKITDTGVGIAKSDIPKLFSKFEQFGRTSGPGAKGTGLGLAISKGLIEMHGGKIWVDSEIGQGTTFSFSIPLDKEGK